jgi:hypothetical protein
MVIFLNFGRSALMTDFSGYFLEKLSEISSNGPEESQAKNVKFHEFCLWNQIHTKVVCSGENLTCVQKITGF